MQFCRSFQASPPAARRKCPTCPDSQNRTPKNVASAAYGSCVVPSLPLPRPDSGIECTDIARWTADIHDSSHIGVNISGLSAQQCQMHLALCLTGEPLQKCPKWQALFLCHDSFPRFPVSWALSYHPLCPIIRDFSLTELKG